MEVFDIFKQLKPKEQKFTLDIMLALKTGTVTIEDFELNPPDFEKISLTNKEEKVSEIEDKVEPKENLLPPVPEKKITEEEQQDLDLFNLEETSNIEEDCKEIEESYKQFLSKPMIGYFGMRNFFIQTIGISADSFKKLPKNKMELGHQMKSLLSSFKMVKDLDKISSFMGMSKSEFPVEKPLAKLAFIKILKEEGLDYREFLN